MKITKIKMTAFGKFKNKAIELSPRTVIFGGNEAGKSTVAAFIRLMLFGPQPRSGDRERYIPWDGEFMEGELTYESGGRQYLLYRRFGRSAKGDITKLLCISTGEQSDKPPEFGDGKIFADTAFVAQQMPDIRYGGDLGMALRRAAFGGDDDRVDKALKALAEARKRITNPRGKHPGELDVARKRLDDALLAKSDAAAERDRLPLLRKERTDAEAEFNAAAKDIERLGASCGEDRISALREDVRLSMEAKNNADEELISLKKEIIAFNGGKAPGLLPVWPFLIFAVLFAAGSGIMAVLRYFMAAALMAVAAIGGAVGVALLMRRRSKGITPEQQIESRLVHAKEEFKRRDEEHEKAINALRSAENDAAMAKIAIEDARQRLDQSSRRRGELDAEIKKAESRQPGIYESEIENCKAEIAALEKRLADIENAEIGINRALGRLNEEWLPEISAEISSLASQITGRKLDVLADEAFSLTVHEARIHCVDSYSGGTQDQLYLVLRLAAARRLFGDEAPPLILDDPFIQYDRERQEKAADILLEYAGKNQILIFTCKNTTVFMNKGFRILTI